MSETIRKIGSVGTRCVAVTLLATLITAVSASAAAAHPTGPPSHPATVCSYDDIVISCFEPNGDDFWVYDRESDGASAVVEWWTSGGRSESCRNSHGVATWHECSYDLVEGQRVWWEHWTFDGDTGVWRFVSGPNSMLIT